MSFTVQKIDKRFWTYGYASHRLIFEDWGEWRKAANILRKAYPDNCSKMQPSPSRVMNTSTSMRFRMADFRNMRGMEWFQEYGPEGINYVYVQDGGQVTYLKLMMTK